MGASRGLKPITVGQAKNANTILKGTVKLEDAYEKVVVNEKSAAAQ